MAEIIIYTADYCPYCKRAKDLLTKKGAKFTDVDITNDQQKRIEVMEKSGGRKTVPQIFINGKHIGGSDDLYALDSKGELDKLLAG